MCAGVGATIRKLSNYQIRNCNVMTNASHETHDIWKTYLFKYDVFVKSLVFKSNISSVQTFSRAKKRITYIYWIKFGIEFLLLFQQIIYAIEKFALSFFLSLRRNKSIFKPVQSIMVDWFRLFWMQTEIRIAHETVTLCLINWKIVIWICMHVSSIFMMFVWMNQAN